MQRHLNLIVLLTVSKIKCSYRLSWDMSWLPVSSLSSPPLHLRDGQTKVQRGPKIGPDSLLTTIQFFSAVFSLGAQGKYYHRKSWGWRGRLASPAPRLLISLGLLHFLPWPQISCLEKAASSRIQGTPFPQNESQPPGRLVDSLLGDRILHSYCFFQ